LHNDFIFSLGIRFFQELAEKRLSESYHNPLIKTTNSVTIYNFFQGEI